MLGFKTFLKERYVSIGVRSPHHTKIAADLEKIDGPLIFRGFAAAGVSNSEKDIILVSSMKNAAGEWYGMGLIDHKPYLVKAIKGLINDKMGIKHPVFATSFPLNAANFGSAGILVPRGNSKTQYWYSPKISDILLKMDIESESGRKLSDVFMKGFSVGEIQKNITAIIKKQKEEMEANDNKWAKDKAEELFKTYTKTSTPPKPELSEIIIDTKEYWLIPYSYLKSVYGLIALNSIRTYKDLRQLLETTPKSPEEDNDKIAKKRFD